MLKIYFESYYFCINSLKEKAQKLTIGKPIIKNHSPFPYGKHLLI